MFTNGRCEFKDLAESEGRVTGKVEGNFMRGLYASVTLETEKRFKYADEIIRLNQAIDDAKEQKLTLSTKLEEIQATNKKFSKEMEDLRGYIAETRKLIQEINSSDPMTIEEALEKLQQMHCLLPCRT